VKRQIQFTAALAGLILTGCSTTPPSQSAPKPPTTTATTAPAKLFAGDPKPQYPITYRRPSTELITETMQHIRHRLDGDAEVHSTETTAPEGMTPSIATVSYPWGVVYTGMLDAADATGDKAFADYDAKRFNSMADQLANVNPNAKSNGFGPLRRLLNPRSLDDCGAMGAAFVQARRANVGPDLNQVIDRYAQYVSTKQLRLDDGTLCRKVPVPNSVWGDDMYMSVSLLAQMGALTGETKYFDDATKQVLGIGSRLWVPSASLFTHAWNTENPDNHPHYFWGRANGWCMIAMAQLLEVLPADHPQRAAVLKMFRAEAQGVATVQSGSGLWHQMLDRPDSYLESSCTAMFTFALARGVNRGWLEAPAYGPVAIAGWNGLNSRISDDGHITGTCIGTGYADDYVYYYSRPSTDDLHGYGATLLAGSEMIRLLKNDKFKIEIGERSACTVSLKKSTTAEAGTQPSP
jgi:unsaturated rhamnogalacturonyl hydrolase